MLEHPQVAFRSCELCQKYLFDDETGRPVEKFPGVLYERPDDIPTPCKRPGSYKVNEYDPEETGTNCPKVNPDADVALSEQNLRAYHHYQECRAVNQFPDDPIVRRNAVIIRQIEDALERKNLLQMMRLMISR